MVVDAVISYWVPILTPTEADIGGLSLTIIDLAAYLYADDVLVASTQPERLQRAFDVLTGLFNRVSLQTNMLKTVGMVYHPYHAPGGVSETACAQRVTRKGPTFWERQQMRVKCS